MAHTNSPLRLLAIFLSLVGTSLAVEESTLNEYTDINCNRSAFKLAQVGTPDGVCQGITTANTTAVSVGSLGHGCAITVYTDRFCSNDATAIYAGDCVSIGAFWLSFSVDGCTLNPPTSVSTRIVPLSTSSTRRPPSSTPPNGASPTDTDNPADSASTGSTSPGDTPSATSQSSGLSHGAVAGIAVGATLGGLLLIAALIWFCFIPSRPRRIPVAPDERADDDLPEKRFWFFGKPRQPSYANFPPVPAELTGSYPGYDSSVPVPVRGPVNPVFELSGGELRELAVGPASPTESKTHAPISFAPLPPPPDHPSVYEKGTSGSTA
ncbi:hypothetical protein TWF696_006352 [Orbilia brochopaga]|uniref:Uncharacterized protein n=1 Tax=Orbilia brochopaga TaxID=3140254 RepID=A0AAV9UW23_9PEZI